MDWPAVAQWLFYGALGGIALYVARSIERMRESVESLNVNVAVIVERVESHDKRISKLEEEL